DGVAQAAASRQWSRDRHAHAREAVRLYRELHGAILPGAHQRRTISEDPRPIRRPRGQDAEPYLHRALRHLPVSRHAPGHKPVAHGSREVAEGAELVPFSVLDVW